MIQSEQMERLDRWIERRTAVNPVFLALEGWPSITQADRLRTAIAAAERALGLVPEQFQRHAERMIELPKRRLASMEHERP